MVTKCGQQLGTPQDLQIKASDLVLHYGNLKSII